MFRAITLCFLVFCLFFWFPAYAGIDPLRVLEGSVGRFLLMDTAEGGRLVRKVLSLDARETVSHSKYLEFVERVREPRWTEVREELEIRLNETVDLLGQYREGRPATENSLVRTGQISTDERFLLREISARKFRIAPDAESTGAISFIPEEDMASFASTRASFLEAETGTSLARAQGVKRVTNWFKEMNNCVKNTPPSAQKKYEMRYLLTQIGISEVMTAGGHIIASGTKVIDWKHLSSDLLVSAIWSATGSRMAMGNAKFVVRWVRVTGFGGARSGLDAVLFYINPIGESQGTGLDSDVVRRLEYNMMWNVATSVIPVSLYTFLSGLECLYPGAKMAAASTGIRLLNSTATTIVYFTLRNKWMERE